MRRTAAALVLSLGVAAVLTACGREKAPPPGPRPFEGREAKEVLTAFPDQDRTLVEEADTVTLYTLDPVRIRDGKWSPQEERLRTYGITGSAAITDPDERHRLVEALYRGLKGEGAGPAACFLPRHAVRFEKDGRALDCLICFECTWIYLYGRDGSDTEVRMVFGATVEPVFASLLKAHGLKKSP